MEHVVVLLFELSLIFASAVAGAGGEHEWIDPKQAEARAMACGFEDVEAGEDAAAEFQYLTVSDTDVEEGQLSCLARAMDLTYYFITVPDPYAQRYRELAHEIAAPRMKAMGLQRLAEMGMPPPPEYDPGSMSLGEYADMIEAFCGPETEGMLSGSDYGIVFDPGQFGADETASRDSFAAVNCVLATAATANLPIGFIGNAMIVED